ncbi:Glutathione reductase [Meyerozyma sp. JA9]|nr:Glutathione reductase [Meyerozyma sp. JA9]
MFRPAGLLRTSIKRLDAIHKQLSTMAPVSEKHYDYLVIGGGSGGVASARRAASYGKKVLLVEAQFNRLGGTCVNVGCVPKKVMWYAADNAHRKSQLGAYCLPGGGETSHGDFAWSEFKEKRDAYVRRLNGIYERNLVKEGVHYLFGFARFVNSSGDVEVTVSEDHEFLSTKVSKNEKLTFTADNVLIATGGAPIVPPDVEGSDLGITSDGFFQLTKQPKSVAIVGAGYIGVEFSGFFSALGTQTTMVIRGDTVLRAFDDVIQHTITDHYVNRLGVNMIKQSGSVTKIEPAANGLKKVYLGNGSTVEAEEVLWTIGRKTLVDIGLDVVGVKTNDRGQVVVDEYQQTSNAKIFSLGDVVGKVELTPVAIAAGRRLSNRLFSGKPEFAHAKLDYENIPSVIFSHPEAGSIGLSSKEAEKKYGKDNIKVYQSKFTSMYYAMMDADHKDPTVYKIVCAGPEEKVVGLHLVGDASSEILQGFGVAIKMGATKADFDNCVAIHPTAAEELVTMT